MRGGVVDPAEPPLGGRGGALGQEGRHGKEEVTVGVVPQPGKVG